MRIPWFCVRCGADAAAAPDGAGGSLPPGTRRFPGQHRRTAFSALVLAVAAGLVALAFASPSTEGSAWPAPARDAELPRVACLLPLIMGDLSGHGGVVDPRRDINAADAQ